jgi:hypothetical protein
MSIAQQITLIVEQFPEAEQMLILELVRRINPDDILTSEDIADIEEARAEYARGETIQDAAINWN